MTVEQTGTLATPVEEGKDVADGASHTEHPTKEPDNVPDLVPQEDDDLSTAESNNDSEFDADDVASLDNDFASLIRPIDPDPEPDILPHSQAKSQIRLSC